MTPGSKPKRRSSGFSSRVRPSSLSPPHSHSFSSHRRTTRSLRLAAACATAASVLALLDPRGFAARAYITSGLPPRTQRAFLRRLTDDICNTDPGALTPMMVSSAPALMSAWANEVDRRGEVGGGGRERAMAVEGLLKRMIDERRAGNADAIARTEDYNAVMKSWATSGERSAAALRVEQVSFFERSERKFRRSLDVAFCSRSRPARRIVGLSSRLRAPPITNTNPSPFHFSSLYHCIAHPPRRRS